MTIRASLSGPTFDAQRASYLMPKAGPKNFDHLYDPDAPASSVHGVDPADMEGAEVSAARARFAAEGNDDDGYDAMRDAGHRSARPMRSRRY